MRILPPGCELFTCSTVSPQWFLNLGKWWKKNKGRERERRCMKFKPFFFFFITVKRNPGKCCAGSSLRRKLAWDLYCHVCECKLTYSGCACVLLCGCKYRFSQRRMCPCSFSHKTAFCRCVDAASRSLFHPRCVRTGTSWRSRERKTWGGGSVWAVC